MKRWTYSIAILLCTGAFHKAQAQIDTTFARNSLVYTEYLAQVGKQNLGYAAEKFNLNIAEAGIEMARVFPDPALTLGTGTTSQHRMRMGYNFGTDASWTLELGGKRKARIHLAESQTELTRALLENYFRNLRADATLGYLNGLKQKNIFDVQLDSYNNMKGIADADSIRFKLGQITEIDARQSRLEAGSMLNDVYQGEADWKTALVQLGIMLGKQGKDTLYFPTGDFSGFDRNFDLGQLIVHAQNNRADLIAALRNKTVSQRLLTMAKANRVADLGLNFGIGNTSVVTNTVAPTPSSTAISGGIAIPLKFSNKYKGDLKAASYGIQQADVLYRQTELQIQGEVIQAWFNYLSAQKQARQFNTGLLSDAKRVLDGKTYSYKRGETSLLELLNAQRTYNDTQRSYFETLYNYAAALVEVERAAGIWDIQF